MPSVRHEKKSGMVEDNRPSQNHQEHVVQPFAPASIPVRVGTVTIGDLKGRRPSKTKAKLANLRLRSIEKLIKGRHGGACTTDDGDLYLEAALPCLVDQAGQYGREIASRQWAEHFTPLLLEEYGPEWFVQAEADAALHPRYLKSDQLAALLHVTAEEVRRYGLRTFGAVDRKLKQRKQERRAADRLYQDQKRREAGARSRGQSLSAQRPWVALGMSRATFYRRGLNHQAEVPISNRNEDN